ncbi:hypothetical protein [Bosea sp. BH3]|uniref:hypothetical protein n=1 Tax=Bosea sp. BH3 TaxID=2871701 RepID=UPI0021CAECDD|nr:hypothetical protein [Bosea sp. BH3]MCU4178619.1 hypothetical protein [Bosea sp. BH3]
MTNTIRDKLAALPAKASSPSIKQRFFEAMPDIELALDRKVPWASILAELESAGLRIEPEVASNYASQYRKRNGTLKWTIRRNAENTQPHVDDAAHRHGVAGNSSTGSASRVRVAAGRLKPSSTVR